MANLDSNEWFQFLPKRKNARIRLFCFPYGGGSANVFRGWDQKINNDVEVVALKLPGRGSRIKEQPIVDWEILLDNLEASFLNYIDRPFVFFGHSLGACIAFDLTKRLQTKKLPLPKSIFLSACHCPHIPAFKSSVHDLPQTEFFEQVFQMNGTPVEILSDERLMASLEPALRADMLLAELWSGTAAEKVSVPIIACCGLSDQIATSTDMECWDKYTTAEFSLYFFQGDHFFLHTNQTSLLNLISTSIQSTTNAEEQLFNINNNKTEYSENKTISQLFEEQVVKNPHATALIYKDQKMTYLELNKQANQLAHYLLQYDVGNNTLIGICFERSFNMIVALLAILKTGSAYLPLDQSYPKERLEFMLKDARVSLVISENSAIDDLSFIDITTINLDQDWKDITTQNESNLLSTSNIDDRAYVIYTSGSTGKPKGVEAIQRGVIRLVFGANYAHFDSSRVFLFLSPISFDAATFEIWGALLHGAQCVIFASKWPTVPALQAAIKNHAITTIFFTTALFNTLIDENPLILANVQQVLTGGEAHSVVHMKKALSVLPTTTEIINVYGPTETTTFATYYPVRYLNQKSLSIPIGYPISNTQIYILDENLSMTATGMIGELYIGGAGLARGYLYQPELTQEKFINNLFNSPIRQRLYKTGDRVRFLEDGTIDFIGRVDDQVKIHGFRIELGEIEAKLRSHPQIKQVAVIVQDKAYDDKKLAAYFVSHNTTPPEQKELVEFLREKIPKYMIPTYFYGLAELPLTPSGKVDRKALMRVQ